MGYLAGSREALYTTPEVSLGSLHVSPVACLWYIREGRPYLEGEGEIVRDERVRSGQPESLSLFLSPPESRLSRTRLGIHGPVFMGPLVTV